MTVSSNLAKQSYAGDGVTLAFSFPAYFLADADLTVILRVNATGVETTKILTTDYTVTGAGNPLGGTVTMVVAPAVGETLTIVRDPDALQGTDYVANDALPAEVLERGFDLLTMLIQRLQEVDARTMKYPETDSSSISAIIPSSVDRAGELLSFDSNGAPTTLSIAGLGITVNSAALIVVSAIAPSHVNGQIWINTGTANTLIFNADDGTDFIEMFRVATNTNLFTIPNLVASIAEVLAGIENTKFITADRLAALHEEGSTIASAGSISIPGTGGGFFHVTGTTTINTISGTGIMNGYEATFVFDGVLTLTNGANLILPSGANITTAANDVAKFRHEGSGVWRCVSFERTSGRAIVASRVAQIVEDVDSAVATTTTVMPIDDTIPQNTEGAEVLSVTITPVSATSKLVVDWDVNIASNTGGANGAAALFVDSGADAVMARGISFGATGVMESIGGQYVMTSGGVSPITFAVRAGPESAATLTINGEGGARRFGGVAYSYLRVTEILTG